jgi:hypothetical protein
MANFLNNILPDIFFIAVMHIDIQLVMFKKKTATFF